MFDALLSGFAAARNFAPLSLGMFAQHLVIVARYPQLGRGKRRLAKDIGAVQALRVQRSLLLLTIRRLSASQRWITWIAITPDHARPWPKRVRILPQGGGDLGQRMARISRQMPPGPVVIVGSDLPSISANDIVRAFRALGRYDAVFGPARDGGYWLVGLRRRPRRLNPFTDVRWSSQNTLQDTLANLGGRAVSFLDRRLDIDDGRSLALYPARAISCR